MSHISYLGAVVATMIIMGCGGPSPDSTVGGQVSGSTEALLATSTQQSASHVALPTKTTDGSCSAPDTNSAMVAVPSPARLPNERIDAACVQRDTQQGRYVQGQEHLEITAQLQAQEQELLMERYHEMASMTYTLADQENEPDQAHELWMEQLIQEVMNFDET